MKEAEFVGVTRYFAFNDVVTDDANLSNESYPTHT